MIKPLVALFLIFFTSSIYAALPEHQKPHQSGPMTIYLGGFNLTDLLDSSINLQDLQSKFLKYTGLTEEELSGAGTAGVRSTRQHDEGIGAYSIANSGT